MSQAMFNLAALESALAGTIFPGKLHFHAVTDSTNNDALAAARSGAPHGSVYFADEQRAGRGRGDHGWHSAAGEGLYVSVLLRPQIPAVRLPLLPLAAGLAAAHAIRAATELGPASGINIDLRWPNDLLIGPRKAGGILVESQTEDSAVRFAVVGIGINVHQRSFEPGLPPQRRSGRPGTLQGRGIAGDPGFSTPATSLDLESGRRIPRQSLLVALLKSLQRESLALGDEAATEEICARVELASTWVRGRSVEVHGPQARTGVTAGLDKHGFLLVRTDAGLVTVQTGGIRAARKD
jgi:BirA family transcriptional regulator, biotin operon repressor / biotin---[acetyl-CoA-carboxylase] ligase